MDEPVEIEIADDFVSILEGLGATPVRDETIHYWTEDTLVPYTEYDYARDRVRWLRVWYKRHLAPPV